MDLTSWGIAFLSLLFPLITTLYWYFTRHWNYWKTQGIPYLTRWPFVEQMRVALLTPIHEIDMKRYPKFGRLFGFYEGPFAILSVADPDILRDVFVKNFHNFRSRRNFDLGDTISTNAVSMIEGDDKWKRIRTIITPSFTTGKIKKMTQHILDCAWPMAKTFNKYAEEKRPVDVKVIFGLFSMDVIASCAFGTKIDSQQDPDNKFLQAVTNASSSFSKIKLLLLIFLPKLMKLLKVDIFPSFFTDTALAMISERKKTGKNRVDFLQYLIDAESASNTSSDNDTVKNSDYADKKTQGILENNDGLSGEKSIEDIGHEEENSKLFKQSETKKSLSRDEMIAQCVLFLLAGHETINCTLSHIAYCIALNPEYQEKLIEDIDTAVQNFEGKLTYDSIQSMKYLDKVLYESLRLFPILPRLERKAEADIKIGDTGVILKKDMVINIPVFCLHRDPQFYPEPEKFDPERFSEEAKAQRHSYVYLPFGAGPRNCLGMRFALMEVKICVAVFFSQFRVKRCKETKEPLDFSVGSGMLQPKNVMLTVERRTDNVLSAPDEIEM